MVAHRESLRKRLRFKTAFMGRLVTSQPRRSCAADTASPESSRMSTLLHNDHSAVPGSAAAPDPQRRCFGSRAIKCNRERPRGRRASLRSNSSTTPCRRASDCCVDGLPPLGYNAYRCLNMRLQKDRHSYFGGFTCRFRSCLPAYPAPYLRRISSSSARRWRPMSLTASLRCAPVPAPSSSWNPPTKLSRRCGYATSTRRRLWRVAAAPVSPVGRRPSRAASSSH